MHGYVTSIRRGAKNFDFVDLVDPQLRKRLQLVVNEDVVGPEGRDRIRKIRPHSPVAVSGQLVNVTDHANEPDTKQQEKLGTSNVHESNISYIPGNDLRSPDWRRTEKIKMNPYVGEVADIWHIEMIVEGIRLLNHFPDDIIAQTDTNFSLEKRHLQLRTSSILRRTLQARSKAQSECRKYLFKKGFDEIETPILFKSTSEGAREFLVPTRQRGLAYALPQSPQQWKQILMASGFSKYFQFARCFRDEAMRADRQPEFTQVGLCSPIPWTVVN